MVDLPGLRVSAELDEAIEREWHRLASPSSFFTGLQRVALATEARRERAGDPTPTGDVSEPAAEAARRLVTQAMTARREWVEDLEARGLSRLAYVEIVGLVSRLEAVDCFDFGVGRPLRPLPRARPGEPTGEVDPNASMRGAWVPTIATPEAPVALSAIPAEHHALHDIHGSFFISAEQIFDFGLTKDLIRPQMELIAARTSMVNDCFYWLFAHSRFLREGSKAHDVEVDLRAVRDSTLDPLLPSGRELLAVADAVALWDHEEMPVARDALVAAVGEAGAVRAMGVAGNYAMMNIVLDGVGNPIREDLERMADELGVDYWRTDLKPT